MGLGEKTAALALRCSFSAQRKSFFKQLNFIESFLTNDLTLIGNFIYEISYSFRNFVAMIVLRNLAPIIPASMKSHEFHSEVTVTLRSYRKNLVSNPCCNPH